MAGLKEPPIASTATTPEPRVAEYWGQWFGGRLDREFGLDRLARADHRYLKKLTRRFDEIILVNVAPKPHVQVKDEMARFMAEVALTCSERT